MDGGYRRIAVKVKRRGAEGLCPQWLRRGARTRTVPVLRFESNALSALSGDAATNPDLLAAGSLPVP